MLDEESKRVMYLREKNIFDNWNIGGFIKNFVKPEMEFVVSELPEGKK